MKMERRRIFPKVVLGIMLVILGTLSVVQAQKYELVIVWEERFEGSLDGWYAHNYIIAGETNENDTDPSSGLYIDADGILRATHKPGTHLEFVHRPSSVVYGKWSFDWTVNGSHSSRDVFLFGFSDPGSNYNWHGKTDAQCISGFAGYGLFLDNSPGEVWLLGYPMLPTESLATYDSSGDFTGSHHIDISRDLNGNITVFFDSEFCFSVIDTTTTTSETIGFGSFWGDSGIDNITISEWQLSTTTTTTTTTTESTLTTTTTQPSTTTSTTTTDESTSVSSPGIDLLIVVPIIIAITLYKRRGR